MARRRRSSSRPATWSATAPAAAAATGRRAARPGRWSPRDVREGKLSVERAGEASIGGEPRSFARDAVDPIGFEVIRNALVAATDEMVLALRRSAYSTNIKTRSDFSAAFFDAELRAVAQGFAQPVHLGSMVEQVPEGDPRVRAERLGPGDMLVTNDPFPSGVHLNDISLIAPVHARRRAARLRREHRPPRRRRRWCAGKHRRLPRGLPGGSDHSAGQARRGRTDRRRRVRARARPDPLQA